MKETIQSEDITVDWRMFLQDIKKYSHIRVGVKHQEPPFENVYFKAIKKEVIDIVRMNQMDVTYSIMWNSRARKDLKDVMYISKLKQTLV